MLKKDLALQFKAKDIENNDVQLSDVKGKKVVSLYPKLNTRICDIQTGVMRDWSEKYPKVNFVSISRDSVKTTNEWCGSHGAGNSVVWSDREYKELGANYKLVALGMLKRGFILVNEANEIVDFKIEDKTKNDPDYDLVEGYLKGETKW